MANQAFTTFSHPFADLGASCYPRPPHRWLRPLIAATVCRLKGHDFRIQGNILPSKETPGSFHGCRRCYLRHFPYIYSKDEFDVMIRDHKAEVAKIIREDVDDA